MSLLELFPRQQLLMIPGTTLHSKLFRVYSARGEVSRGDLGRGGSYHLFYEHRLILPCFKAETAARLSSHPARFLRCHTA